MTTGTPRPRAGRHEQACPSPVAALVMVALLAAPLTAQDRAWWDTLPPVEQPRITWSRQSVHVPMRDGVRLAVDLYLPTGADRAHPVATILHQTRYRRGLQFRDPAREAAAGPTAGLMPFLQAGYAVVIVDVRGTGASFGSRTTEFSPEEVRDGWDVLDWIVAQPWSDGVVGATGISYPGTTAELAGTLGHPALKAVAPLFSIYDFLPDVIRPGGIFLDPFFRSWASLVARMDANRLDPPGGPVTGVRPVDGPEGGRLLAEAIAEHAANASIHPQAAALTSRDARSPDGISLDAVSPHARYDTLSRRIPIYSYGGWADGFSGSQIARFVAQPSPGSRLLMGPWNHGGAWAYYPGQRPVRSQFDQSRELLRFFDWHLRGIPTGIEHEPPVWYFTTGSNQWKSAERWPVATRDTVVTLAGSREGGPVRRLAVNPTLGTGNQSRWNTILGGGAVAYRPRQASDTAGQLHLTVVPVLEAPLTLTGRARVRLELAAAAPGTTLFLYLEEVDATGAGALVAEGQVLAPGPGVIEVALLPVSHQFAAGRGIRVVVTRRDIDHFAADATTGTPVEVAAVRVTLPIEP
ncbi:MAG: CocE/NonD family hydrolase [Gemmatimonadetes bacterium]|nr:CocE/NonD family hydrolase [Gemmatimonadota bacterium]MCA9768064.1 CocE/NonD family hydrolase [Gemmatimonadota bacterium]MCB9505298.1 CocE/NonD family hydrolase [Gemmatimonadales bacterium]MCB9518006.1 CocE/NonD family hydrolase [Gemmatimonadales bacterium]HPF61023.1 CocE/NonD family hydrolase [Gemmatimonadales bacterium]